jgi:hypothetical protein
MNANTAKQILSNSGLPFTCPASSPAGVALLAALPLGIRVVLRLTKGKAYKDRACEWIAANWRRIEPTLSKRFPVQ